MKIALLTLWSISMLGPWAWIFAGEHLDLYLNAARWNIGQIAVTSLLSIHFIDIS